MPYLDMLAEKGFWVGIILLFATSAAAIDFQYTLTQHLSGEIGSKYCPVDKDKDYLTVDETYATLEFINNAILFTGGVPMPGLFAGIGTHWEYKYRISNAFFEEDSLQILELPYEYPIKGYSSNAHFGKNDHFVLSGIAVYGTTGNVKDFAYGYDPNGKESKNRWIDSRTINATGKTVRACAGCGRDGCDTSGGAYHIFLDSPPRKNNVTRAEGKKPLGEAKDLAKPQFYENAQILGDSTSPIVYVGVDSNKNVYACVDTDKDKTCDSEQAQACESQGGDWNALWPGKTQSLCCGVTHTPTAECQYYGDLKSICGKNPEGKFKWAAAGLEGQARQLSCPTPISFLADGTELYACGSPPAGLGTFKTFTKKRIKENDFICIDSKIYECGKGSMAEDNKFKEGGELVNANGEINFCSPSGNWITDLDTDKDACIAVAKKKTWDVAWTGSKCCGDPGDDDTYEDRWEGEGSIGGCYKNKFIASGDFADDEKTIINYQGEFYACNPGMEQATTSTTTLPETTLTIKETGACGKPKINATFTGIKHNIVCEPTGQWKFIEETEMTYITETKWETETPEGCCREDQCWDGTKCRETGEYYTLEEKGYRCE